MPSIRPWSQFVQAGLVEGWRHVRNDGCHAAPLGLQGFADVVDDVGVELRHVGDHGFAGISGGEADLAGQPFVRRMRRRAPWSRLETLLQPQVEGEILADVRRQRDTWYIFRKIPTARRLRREQQVAEVLRRKDEMRLASASFHSITVDFWFALEVLTMASRCLRLLVEPLVVGDRQQHGVAATDQFQRAGRPAADIGAVLAQGIEQRILRWRPASGVVTLPAQAGRGSARANAAAH